MKRGAARKRKCGRTISGGEDRTLQPCDVASGEGLRRFVGHTAVVHAVACTSGSKTVLSGRQARTVKLWDVCGL